MTPIPFSPAASTPARGVIAAFALAIEVAVPGTHAQSQTQGPSSCRAPYLVPSAPAGMVGGWAGPGTGAAGACAMTAAANAGRMKGSGTKRVGACRLVTIGLGTIGAGRR